ncbi:hypothetical protein SAMN05661099_1290 [Daejeonella lutea]|uniref:Uncharacterized protein n=1 Tax=Daejeonella lutea TaxID=572036 RepID=A0A1T5B4P4_9SPHI|nr:hypothetical protein SAMN05661099_1290 [Daejeonella lutea]
MEVAAFVGMTGFIVGAGRKQFAILLLSDFDKARLLGIHPGSSSRCSINLKYDEIYVKLY